MTLAVYNSAGERVKVIYQGTASAAGTPVLAEGSAGAGPISLNIAGIQGALAGLLHWDGENDNGQWVSNGTYYLQMSSTNTFGTVETVSVAVQVVGAGRLASVEIYNSAGELVRVLSLSSLSGLPTDISAQTSAFSTEVDPVTGQPQGGLRMDVKLNNSSQQPVVWDGLSDRGQPLASGTYIVKLAYNEAGQRTEIKTLAVTLLAGADSPAKAAVASAFLLPNPQRASSGRPLALVFTPSAQGQGALRAYDLAGELVAEAVDTGNAGRIEVPGKLSSGVYLIEFEIRQGTAVLARRTLKAAVVR